MAYRQRHNSWIKGRSMFRAKRFLRARSSSQIEPLLKDYLHLTDSQFDRDDANGFEELHKRNFDLERKIDELVVKANDIKSRYNKIERSYANDFEALNKKNSDLERKIDELARKVDDLQSTNIENENKKKVLMEMLESKSDTLKAETGKLKEDITALGVKMNDTETRDAILQSLVTIGCKDMKGMEGLSFSDEMLIAMIVLIFLVCFLIGLHI